ncbi:hypothetical protein VFPBJ_01741 [Purpureocillium lilacinum]|uniref:Uncharacterized protein n=1 Tax=Purpureocillium lilacinum TaxID=33203 RepID=A0A179HDQ0_PURLI|nr:hypothetical protein VFPBJ_01741 [Purpureocillium lilacinum]
MEKCPGQVQRQQNSRAPAAPSAATGPTNQPKSPSTSSGPVPGHPRFEAITDCFPLSPSSSRVPPRPRHTASTTANSAAPAAFSYTEYASRDAPRATGEWLALKVLLSPRTPPAPSGPEEATTRPPHHTTSPCPSLPAPSG